MADLEGKIALVTGASRGIGAEVARGLAARGADVVINYRSKGGRAEDVAAAVRALGRRSLLAQADLTDPEATRVMFDIIRETWGRLDLLILNASGALEKDRPAGYAMELNAIAQERALDAAFPMMSSGGRIVFVTSHLAHFHGQKPGYASYDEVAASKRAGEDALRARMPELAGRDIRLIVVSGDIIEGTITPRLMEREQPGLIEARRAVAGALPTVEEFAHAIVGAAADPDLASGATVFVGSVDW
ncbi:MAG TPA: SDR family oxidoreductase [Herpetosiphonaceae bacterium]|nr:SDR family oxidoreductase [Herpetosiphonaceae bacterium]